jgi:hypothetical protein
MNATRRNALLVAFMADCAARSTDAALDIATHLVGGLFKCAERRHLDALVENRRGIGEVVTSDVLERIEAEHPRLRRFAPLLLEIWHSVM